MKMKKLLALGLAGVMALSLAACGVPGEEDETQAAGTEAAGSEAAGGETTGGETADGEKVFRYSVKTEPTTLDSAKMNSIGDSELQQIMGEGLLTNNAGEISPGLAETWEISEDGLTYTFHLRDAKWSNGEAVTAADFVFGWQRAVDPATASEYSYMLSDIGQVVNAAEIIAGDKPVTDLGITAVDDKTLKVELNVPVSYFLSLMYFPTFYPMNQKIGRAHV